MKYKIVTSGKTKVVTLGKISRNLKPSSEVYELSEPEIYLGPVSHKTLVFFVTEFADYAFQNYAKKKPPEAETCISLARKWLEDKESVSKKELISTAGSACAASYSANFGYVVNAALAASNAVYAAYDADDAANASASNAADAARMDRNKEFIRQGNFIIDFLKSGKHLFLV